MPYFYPISKVSSFGRAHVIARIDLNINWVRQMVAVATEDPYSGSHGLRETPEAGSRV
jgi:hypothetical protein